MSQPLSVTLFGFSAFERQVLASAFRLSGPRRASYALVEQAEAARFIVADTDSHGALEAVIQSGRVGDTVFVGAQAPENAQAWMMRPLDAGKVLQELDLMALRGETPGLGAAPALVCGSPTLRTTAGPARRASDAASDDSHRRR